VSKVYITHNSGRLPFDKAEHFGTLVPLVERDVFPDDVDERLHRMAYIMRNKLAAFEQDKDYLLLAGDPVAILLAGLILSEYTKKFRCLKYDRELDAYYVIPIQLP
jgi:hypothetical protein